MCPEFNKCKFTKKFQNSKDPVLRGLIENYCKGKENFDCIRKNLSPSNLPAELVPSGDILFED